MVKKVFITLWMSAIVYGAPFIVILDNASDSMRQIDDAFEHAISMNYVHNLSAALTQRCADAIRVIQLNAYNKKTDHWYHISAVNRLQAQLYIKFAFFKTEHPKPTVMFYRLACGNEFVSVNPNTLFLSVELAHIPFVAQTERYARLLQHMSSASGQSFITCLGIHAIPCVSLVGIHAPALVCEFGLPNDDSWKLCVDSMATGIESVVKQYMQRKLVS